MSVLTSSQTTLDVKLASSTAGRYSLSSSVVTGVAAVTDSMAIIVTGFVLYFLQIVPQNADTLSLYAAAILSVWITTLLLFHYSELYTFESILRPLGSLDRAALSFGSGLLLLLAAAFALKVSDSYSRVWTASFVVFAFVATFALRSAVSIAVKVLARRGVFRRHIIVVGSRTHVDRLVAELRNKADEFISLNAVFVDGPTPTRVSDLAVLGGLEDIAKFVRSFRVDDVVIAMPWSAERRILRLVEQLRELPVNVHLGADFVGLKLNFQDAPGHFGRAPIYTVVGHPMSGWAIALKVAEDYLLATLFLTVAALPMAVIAILIRLDSPGPAIFRQRRLGFNNQVFWIYKFRTMRHNQAPEGKTIQATEDDARVTTIGKALRRTSLDELPQLINVLNGTMSLVGPRPHAIDHNEEYSRSIRGYFGRHRVKPGLTGWAQVNGFRGLTDTPDKMEMRVRYDVFYADNWSLLFDLRIILQTVVVLITGKNAH